MGIEDEVFIETLSSTANERLSEVNTTDVLCLFYCVSTTNFFMFFRLASHLPVIVKWAGC